MYLNKYLSIHLLIIHKMPCFTVDVTAPFKLYSCIKCLIQFFIIMHLEYVLMELPVYANNTNPLAMTIIILFFLGIELATLCYLAYEAYNLSKRQNNQLFSNDGVVMDVTSHFLRGGIFMCIVQIIFFVIYILGSNPFVWALVCLVSFTAPINFLVTSFLPGVRLDNNVVNDIELYFKRLLIFALLTIILHLEYTILISSVYIDGQNPFGALLYALISLVLELGILMYARYVRHKLYTNYVEMHTQYNQETQDKFDKIFALAKTQLNNCILTCICYILYMLYGIVMNSITGITVIMAIMAPVNFLIFSLYQ